MTRGGRFAAGREYGTHNKSSQSHAVPSTTTFRDSTLCQTPYEHGHIPSFTEENPRRDGSIAFPRSLGDYPPGLGLSLPRHTPWTPHPGHVRSRVLIPQHVLLASGSQSRSSWETLWRGGDEGRAQLFCWRTGKKTPLLEASPAALLVSYKLPPHLCPHPWQGGQLHCSILRVCFMEPGRRGNPSPASLGAQKSIIKTKVCQTR